jgi:hypothetical protein
MPDDDEELAPCDCQAKDDDAPYHTEGCPRHTDREDYREDR